MAEFTISGVWKNNNDVVIHYAFHQVLERTIYRAEKKSKAEAIALLETKGNSAVTWVWDYNKATWNFGEEVEVVRGFTGKYLRSNRNNRLTDNLGHLINYEWIYP